MLCFGHKDMLERGETSPKIPNTLQCVAKSFYTDLHSYMSQKIVIIYMCLYPQLLVIFIYFFILSSWLNICS